MLSKSIIARLNHQHETLRELLNGFSEADLRRRGIPEKWSIFEQTAHLAAYQPAFLARLYLMARQDNPSFERYVAANDPHFHECCHKSPDGLFEHIDSLRLSINQHLVNLSGQDLLRTGLHPKYGKMTITGWTEFFLLHEAHHLFSIFMLAREMNIYSQQA
jgi:hypothetical protein